MPKIYSAQEERAFLLGDLGYRFDLDADVEGARKVHGLGTSAHAFLGTAVRCFLVGLDDPALSLLKKAQDWLVTAIGERERPKRYFPAATEAARFRDLALSRWMLSNEHDAASLLSFVDLQDQYLRRSPLTDKVSLSLTLVTYLDARAYERVVELVGHENGKPSGVGRRVKSETDVALSLARRRAGQDVALGDLAAQLLQHHGPRWLGEGHYLRFAEWVKVLRWTPDSGKRAKEVLLEGRHATGVG